jgi:general secretion pathway protein I
MSTPRRGFSLLEVLMATGILLACVIVLAELAGIGRQHAVTAEELVTAQWLCQTRLNELLAGALPLVEVENEWVAETPGWVYSVQVDPLAQTGLVAVRVTVSKEAEGLRPPRQFSLVRWLRRPAYRFESEAEPAGADESATWSEEGAPR